MMKNIAVVGTILLIVLLGVFTPVLAQDATPEVTAEPDTEFVTVEVAEGLPLEWQLTLFVFGSVFTGAVVWLVAKSRQPLGDLFERGLATAESELDELTAPLGLNVEWREWIIRYANDAFNASEKEYWRNREQAINEITNLVVEAVQEFTPASFNLLGKDKAVARKIIGTIVRAALKPTLDELFKA